MATDIRLRAERKAGALLRAMAESGARDAGEGGNRKSRSREATVKLDDLGVTKSQSSRWQQLSALDEAAFAARVATAKKNALHCVEATREERNAAKAGRSRDARGGRWRHYPTSTTEEIAARDVAAIAAPLRSGFSLLRRHPLFQPSDPARRADLGRRFDRIRNGEDAARNTPSAADLVDHLDCERALSIEELRGARLRSDNIGKLGLGAAHVADRIVQDVNRVGDRNGPTIALIGIDKRREHVGDLCLARVFPGAPEALNLAHSGLMVGLIANRANIHLVLPN
jgi:hypothetical protein